MLQNVFRGTAEEENTMIENRKMRVATLEESVRMSTKALLYGEISRFHNERNAKLQELTGTYLAMNRHLIGLTEKKWSETCAVSSLDMTKYESNMEKLTAKNMNAQDLEHLFTLDSV